MGIWQGWPAKVISMQQQSPHVTGLAIHGSCGSQMHTSGWSRHLSDLDQMITTVAQSDRCCGHNLMTWSEWLLCGCCVDSQFTNKVEHGQSQYDSNLNKLHHYSTCFILPVMSRQWTVRYYYFMFYVKCQFLMEYLLIYNTIF